MKFQEYEDTRYFRSDQEHILDIVEIVSLPIGQQQHNEANCYQFQRDRCLNFCFQTKIK